VFGAPSIRCISLIDHCGHCPNRSATSSLTWARPGFELSLHPVAIEPKARSIVIVQIPVAMPKSLEIPLTLDCPFAFRAIMQTAPLRLDFIFIWPL